MGKDIILYEPSRKKKKNRFNRKINQLINKYI